LSLVFYKIQTIVFLKIVSTMTTKSDSNSTSALYQA